MDLEFGLKSSALSEQVLCGVESIVDVHVSVVASNAFGQILGTLASLLAALLLHAHVDSVKDLVTEFLSSFGQLIRVHSDSLDVFDDLFVTRLDGRNNKPTHAEDDSGGRT